MPIEKIYVGSAANDGSGDSLRTAWGKVNSNFDWLLAALGNYVTSATLAGYNYVSSSSLATTLADYVTATTLAGYNYVSSSSLATTLADYVTSATLAGYNYVTSSSLATTLADYVTSATLAGYNYVTSSSLATTLAGYAKLAVAQSFTKAQRVTPVSLTSSAGSIAVDFALSNNFSHTLTENTTLANPSNIVAGQSGQITITQHASAAKTLGFGSYWKSTDGSTPAVSTTVSSVNLITYYVNNSTHITFSLIKHGAA